MKEKEFKPKIVSFLCNWCAYADPRDIEEIKAFASIFPIRVMCLGRVDPLYVIKAYILGADAVMLAGCRPEDCHYKYGNLIARRRYALLKEILESFDLDAHRIKLYWVSAPESTKFAKVVKEIVEEIKKKGPNPFKEEMFI